MCFMKHAVRYAVIAGLVGGAAAIVVGPERLGALFEQARGKVNQAIDANIEDPIALRAQMRALEGQYPDRIAEVRGDLAELQAQKAQLNRELEVSDRVVSLAARDLDQMRDLIARGEAATLSGDGTQVVRVVFNNQSVDLKDAYTKASRIQQVQAAYTTRAGEIQRDLGYLETQEQRLTELAQQLEQEYAEFQSQMWMMDRQVDSIARNDRLIGMMEKRQRTLDEQSRYKANSIQQLSGRFADIRARQEARLQALGTASSTLNYEDRAKVELDVDKAFKSSTDVKASEPVKPAVIEIRPERNFTAPKADEQGEPFASR